MRKIALSLVMLAGLSLVPADAYQPWYLKATSTRGASARIVSGSVRATVQAYIVEKIEDADPETSPPQTSTVAYVCASVSKGSAYDGGCGIVPVVIDAQLGTAQASGTISPANCLSYCAKGTIAVSVSWAATSSYVPAVPSGQPFSVFLLPPGVEVFPSARVTRVATAVGSASSSIAGTASGTDAAAEISETAALFVALY